MAVEWRITYTIDPPIQIEPADPTVPSLYLELHYTDDGLLKGATHIVTTASADDIDEAWETSRLDLLIYWEALRYNSGTQLRVRPVYAITEGHQATQMYPVMKPEHGGFARAPDASRLASAPPGLATWLWLANASTHEPDDASALRSYYVVLEGIHGERPGDALVDIRYARDFVSHGRITSHKARSFLERVLGYTAAEYRYDPHDRKHRVLVRQYRQLAERAVKQKLSLYV